MGLSTIMLRDTQNKQNKEFLESILNNSKRLNTLAESLIDVAKIHNNTLKINKRIVNFNILVSRLLPFCHILIPQSLFLKDIQISEKMV